MTSRTVRMECGHTARVGNPYKRQRRCVECPTNDKRALTHIKIDGEWVDWDAAKKAHTDANIAADKAARRIVARERFDGGLAYHQRADGKVWWWCHVCWGPLPESTTVSLRGSISEAVDQWKLHKQTPRHLENLETV